MIRLEYNQTDFADILKHLARQLKVKIRNQQLVFPEQVASGHIRFAELYHGLQVLISDYRVHTDLLLERKKSSREVLSLRFDELVNEGQEDRAKTSVVLTNSRFDWLFLSPAGMHVRSLSIRFDRKWMDQYLGGSEAGESIAKYLALKASSFQYDAMEAGYRQWFRQLFECRDEEDVHSMVIHNRVMLLIERFFTRIHTKMDTANFSTKVSSDDIMRIKQVEALLVQDFSNPPPTLEQLARTAAMSSSKLKVVFKEIYGMPLFQYYQKQRMQKAKAMLLSKKYSLNQVSQEMGYQTIGNFAKAFQQAFQQSPAELLP